MKEITQKLWGQTNTGETLYLFRLENDEGSYVEITNYGAAIVSVVVPDNSGHQGNVVVGFPEAQGYINDHCYIGSTIGRYANRISNAGFHLDGKVYHLEANDGAHTNHGGNSGYNSRVFEHKIINSNLVLSLLSPDGDAGFPGNLELMVCYHWSNNNELTIHYKAVSDQQTPANFTNHTYFNLAGSSSTILKHRLSISAERLTHLGRGYIPDGTILPLGELAFTGQSLMEKVGENESERTGINTFYILEEGLVSKNAYAAELSDPHSGRTMIVNTSYPGIFLYTGDYLASEHLNHFRDYCFPFGGLCLECQHYPDSVNQPQFPQAVLKVDQNYNEFITFKFGLI
jgi:aldose 1-epimerase